MESGGRRSQEERAAARDARARAREPGPEAPADDSPPREKGWKRPDLDSMRRYGGGHDVFMRRRLVAIAVAAVLLLVLFMMLGGC